MRKYLLRTLLLSCLLSTIALAPAWTQPSKPESTQASQQPEKLYTEAQVLESARVAAQAAVDVAVPLAVREAVAQKEGELAASDALKGWWEGEAGRYRAEALGWRVASYVAVGATVIALTVAALKK